MKNIQNISWGEWKRLAQRCGKYVFVLVIFSVFTFYTVVVIPKEPPKKSQSSSDQSADRIVWDITTKKPEKTFTGVLQGRPDDWYRMSVSMMANRATRIDVNLSSVFSKDVSIGSFDIAESDDPQYYEILFQLPDSMFSDIKFVLRTEDAGTSWSYTGVKLSEFAASKLNVRSKAEVDRLAPTLAGNIEHNTKTFVSGRQSSDSKVIFESHFVAEDDFIENIRLNAKEDLKNNGYVLELREKTGDDTGNPNISIKKAILSPGELGAVKDEWGNQSIELPARLERGKEYGVSLTGTGDASRNITLSPLEGLRGAVLNSENTVAIVFGRYIYAEGGALMSGSRVEDFGNEILYSYSLSGRVNDFFNLFDTKGSVKFDTKGKIIVGKQQQHTSFTYRFFTVYPFKKFMFAAQQAGNSENEIKLEYSYDNAFWREVPSTQENDEPQIFSLSLIGTSDQRIIYVRVSYNGEDKKTGTFGLDKLLVRAELIRK